MRWFKRGKSFTGTSNTIDQIPITSLQTSIGTTSILSTEPINDAWGEVTGENPMSQRSNYVVRAEMLWFFLHMLNRFAFDAGGPEFRAILQDAIAVKAVKMMIESSFDASRANPGFDVEDWRSRMVTSGVEEMNGAEADYSSCADVFAESGVGAFLREDSIIGRLAGRIAREADQEHNPELRLLIGTTAVDALIKSGLKQQVDQAYRVLGGQH